jgi:hypothetical protein
MWRCSGGQDGLAGGEAVGCGWAHFGTKWARTGRGMHTSLLQHCLLPLGFTMQFDEAKGFGPSHGGGGFPLHRRGADGWSRRRVVEARMPVTIETRLCSLRTMVSFTRHYLVEGIAASDCVYSLATLRKNLDLGIPDRTMGMFSMSFYLLGISFFGAAV